MKRFGNRGFATLVAITLLALVGAAMVATTTAFSIQARRTRDEATEAQLRQLLYAAELQAKALSNRADVPSKPINISIPDELANDGAKVGVRVVDNFTAEIIVTQGRHHMQEEFRHSRRR